MDRLTTDNRETNLQTLLNYAYAKDRAVHLAYGNGEDNIPLDEYIAHEASKLGCPRTTTEVMEGGCMECDCPIAILNAIAIQAAELRARLMMIEDILGDTYNLDHLRELIEADREGRITITPAPAKEGDPKPSCFYNDNGGLWCNGMAPNDGDEPTEHCKQCRYCESGYAALEEE